MERENVWLESNIDVKDLTSDMCRGRVHQRVLLEKSLTDEYVKFVEARRPSSLFGDNYESLYTSITLQVDCTDTCEREQVFNTLRAERDCIFFRRRSTEIDNITDDMTKKNLISTNNILEKVVISLIEKVPSNKTCINVTFCYSYTICNQQECLVDNSEEYLKHVYSRFVKAVELYVFGRFAHVKILNNNNVYFDRMITEKELYIEKLLFAGELNGVDCSYIVKNNTNTMKVHVSVQIENVDIESVECTMFNKELVLNMSTVDCFTFYNITDVDISNMPTDQLFDICRLQTNQFTADMLTRY